MNYIKRLIRSGIFFCFLTIGMMAEASSITGQLANEEFQIQKKDFYITPDYDDLNIRSGPSTDYPIIGEALMWKGIHVIGQSEETGWYLVEVDGNEGFLTNNLVAPVSYIVHVKNSDEEQDKEDSEAEEWDETLSSDGYEGQTASFSETSCNIIEPEGNVSQERLNAFNERLSMAPQYLLDAFTELGWHMYLTEYDVGSVYADGQYGPVQGIIFYEDHVIYLDNRDVVIEAVLHEFGHFADWYAEFQSASDEFMQLYYNADTFNSYFNFTNGKYDEREVYAEVFYDYLTRGDELASVCPDMYAFMSARY